jgi:hypothetical protein
MRRADLLRRAGCAALVAGLLTAGCGTIQPQVAYPNVEDRAREAPAAPAVAPGRRDDSLAGLRVDDQRVADVAYRIVIANVDLCSDVKPQTGLVLQSALQYSPRARAAAERAFQLGDPASIEAVAAGSPAAEAGLRDGDALLAVNGQPLPTGAPAPPEGPDARPATRAPVDEAEAAIDAALAQGPARLRFQRGGEQLEVVLPRRLGCAYDAQVLPGPVLNASADGRHVFVSAALVDYARTDDMLAVFLGHEFAHDVLHHHQREDEKGLARNVLGELGSSPASHMVAEKEADYVGLYLTARAGYDIARAPDVFRDMPDSSSEFSLTHPGNQERAAALAATRDEILAKRQRGEPLIPNPARRSRPS